MSNNYSKPTYINWNQTDYGSSFSEQITNEVLYVADHRGILFGLPDNRYGVKIKGMSEIPLQDVITKPTQFKVDYKLTGTVFFHPDFAEKQVIVESYYSKGLMYFPASRIWTKIDSLGNVIQSLDDVLGLIIGIEDKETELNDLYRNIQSALDEFMNSYETIAELSVQVEQMKKDIERILNESIARINKTTNENVRKLNDSFNNYYFELTDLKELAKYEINKEAEDVLNEVNSKIKDLESKIDEIDNLFGDISNDFEKLKNKMKTESDQIIREYNNKFEEDLEKWNDDFDLFLESSKSKIMTLKKDTNDYILKITKDINEKLEELLALKTQVDELKIVLEKLMLEANVSIEKLTNKNEESSRLLHDLIDINKKSTDMKNELEIIEPRLNQLLEDLLNQEKISNETYEALRIKVEEANKVYEDIESQLTLIDLDKLKLRLEDLERDSHTHRNSITLNGLEDKNGYLYYKSKKVGSGNTLTQKETPQDWEIGDQWHQIIE